MIADGLERLALSVDAPPSRVRILPSRPAVRANRGELLELADRLRDGGQPSDQGIAELRRVVTDGTGPAYTDPHGSALASQLRLARALLGV